MVEVVDNPQERRFEAFDEGAVVGVIRYDRDGDTVTLTHTIVPPEHEGRGIASALAKAALSHARDAHEKVIPECPFVQAYLRRHPEEADVVASNWNQDS